MIGPPAGVAVEARPKASRGQLGLALTTDMAIAVAIALYLAWAKLVDAPTACGPLGGCSTVANSDWSEIAGIPVAVWGAAASAIALAGSFGWWRRADRRGLWVAYLITLASLPILGLLAWLELFVIRAICDWCVAYSVTVVVGLAVAVAAMRRA